MPTCSISKYVSVIMGVRRNVLRGKHLGGNFKLLARGLMRMPKTNAKVKTDKNFNVLIHFIFLNAILTSFTHC